MVATAGAFALFFMGYGAYHLWTVASNQQSVQSAENTALTIVAARIGNGSRRSDAIKVPAFTKTLVGTVVAEPQETAEMRLGALAQGSADAFDIYWDHGPGTGKSDQEKRKTIDTVYVGYIEHQPDGKVMVKTSTKMIGVIGSPAQWSRIKADEPVIAVVPADAKEASRVLLVEELKEQASSVAPLGR